MSEKEIKRNERKIARLEQDNREIVNMSMEINTLSNSDQLYDIQLNVPLMTDDGNKYTAATKYMDTTDAVTVNVYDSGKISSSSLAHELKHCFQFENGTLSFNKKTGVGGTYYDYQDEVEAFQRGSALGGPAMGSMYSKDRYKGHEPGPIPAVIINNNVIRQRDIFRINRVTYK